MHALSIRKKRRWSDFIPFEVSWVHSVLLSDEVSFDNFFMSQGNMTWQF